MLIWIKKYSNDGKIKKKLLLFIVQIKISVCCFCSPFKLRNVIVQQRMHRRWKDFDWWFTYFRRCVSGLTLSCVFLFWSIFFQHHDALISLDDFWSRVCVCFFLFCFTEKVSTIQRVWLQLLKENTMRLLNLF